jgi:hypothetical protein
VLARHQGRCCLVALYAAATSVASHCDVSFAAGVTAAVSFVAVSHTVVTCLLTVVSQLSDVLSLNVLFRLGCLKWLLQAGYLEVVELTATVLHHDGQPLVIDNLFGGDI